jgi:hypothetical protein
MPRPFHFLIAVYAILFSNQIYSQNSNNDSVKSVLSINGYIQSQYQYFFVPDSVGSTTPYFAHFAGGAFVGRFTNDRFTIRRGRVAINHGNTDYRSVLSFDFSERGAHIKDMYVFFQERKFHAFGVTMGMFSRPFGYEIGYSSSLRESPERSRIVQTLFPSERDLGVMIGFKMPEDHPFSIFNFKLGLINGNGSAVETDRWKDVTGRFGLEYVEKNELFSVSAGFSMYNGAMNHIYEPVDTIASNANTKYYIYRFDKIEDPTGRTNQGFVLDTTSTYATGRTGGKVERIYYGVDLQLEVVTAFGKTKLIGEYMWGTQPTPVFYKDVEQAYIIYNGMHSYSPSGPMTGVNWPMYDQPQPYNPAGVGQKIKHHHTFVRKMAGGYICLVQDVFKTPFQVVVKYDWYDPNTEIEGKDIVYDEETYLNDPDYIKPYLSPADLKFETLGFGLIYHYNDNVKLSIYYDNVKNEIGNIGVYEGDIRLGRMPSPGFDRDISDDLITCRLQYKF